MRAISSSGWPAPQDYNEAIQTPASSFADEELRQAELQVNALGLPWCMSGNFASVFCLRCKNRVVAVRCFLRDVHDQQQRYAAISSFVQSDDLPSTVPFEYVERGIVVHGDWYPVLKMQWVAGITLGEFVTRNVSNSVAINLLATCFKSMTLDLRKYGIAHGDLQPDNIIVSEDELRLVDYDGMYVPDLSGWEASELGHAEYQHPRRNSHDFNPRLDNFSAWVIYTSLKALSREPSLWQKQDCGADRLLFRRSDFTEPDKSVLFTALLSHEDPQVRSCAQNLRGFLEVDPDRVPCLDWEVEQAHSAPSANRSSNELAGNVGDRKMNDSSQTTPLPSWMQADADAPTQTSGARDLPGAAPTIKPVTTSGADQSGTIPPWLQSILPNHKDSARPVNDVGQTMQYGAHYLEALKAYKSRAISANETSLEPDELFPRFAKVKLHLIFTHRWLASQLIESGCLMAGEKIELSLDLSIGTSPAAAVVTNMRLIVARKAPYESEVKASSLSFDDITLLERRDKLLKIHYAGSATDPGVIVSVAANSDALNVLLDRFPPNIVRKIEEDLRFD